MNAEELRGWVAQTLAHPVEGWDPREHAVACVATTLLEARHLEEWHALCVLVAAWREQTS